MHVLLVGLLIAMTGQLSDPRYPDFEADAAPVAAAPSQASDSASSPSQITVPPATPAPTLAGGEAPLGDAGIAAEAQAAEAFDANPLRAESPAAPDVDAASANSAAAEAPPESSVLTDEPKPADVMRSLLIVPAGAQLPGVAITLGEAVGGATDRHAQTELAQLYWRLSAAVARYYLAAHELADLNTLRQGIASPAAAWTTAIDEATRHVGIARENATATQLHLHRLIGAGANASLPLPADSPHCGRYNTRYEEIFASRQDPSARQLNDLLPMYYKALGAKSQLIAEAGDWLLFVSENRDTANDGLGLLRAYELLALHRRAFIDAVAEYNQHIAAYAELAAPDQVRPERLVSMLIRVSNNTGGIAGDGVQPASAEAPATADAGQARENVGAAQPRDARPRTFARRPFDRLRNRERSIVSSRQLLRRGLRSRD